MLLRLESALARDAASQSVCCSHAHITDIICHVKQVIHNDNVAGIDINICAISNWPYLIRLGLVRPMMLVAVLLTTVKQVLILWALKWSNQQWSRRQCIWKHRCLQAKTLVILFQILLETTQVHHQNTIYGDTCI